ncbi:MAG: hypothetical protein HQM09_00500 [Candidatus Riflebacteria bacterium]|nr:hypothetical protein [Candidatus Riflebacteria bacterium]
MSMRINQNPIAIRTVDDLAMTSSRLEKSIERLSTGLRINRAADDAAGLSFSERLRRQVRGLSRAISNVQDGASMIQTGEGALNETQDILQRMRELAVQAGSDTLAGSDRLEIQKEVTQLRDDLNRIAGNTAFNTKRLLDGSQSALVSSSSGAARGIVNGLPDTTTSGDFEISIALVTGGISQMLRSQIFTKRDTNPTELAEGSTQLQSIAQFYDANDIFVLSTSQTLTLQGNGRNATVELNGQMTLDELAGSLQNAANTTSGLGIDFSTAAVRSTAQTNIASMGGYLEMISGAIGDSGRISLVGDSSLVSSLGFSTAREPVNNVVEFTMRDSYGNTRNIRTETDRAVGLLDGIDVRFSSQAAQIAGTSGLQDGLSINTVQTFAISAGGDGFANLTVQIDSGYYTLDGLARSINAQIAVAGVATVVNGLEASVVDGQLRIGYIPQAGSTATSTINITGASGAPTLGFLDNTYSGFVDGTKDTSQIVNGFSMYVASGNGNFAPAQVMNFRVSDGGAGIAVINFAPAGYTAAAGSLSSATATVADLVRFTDFQVTANQQLLANNVQVRVDQIGNTMAFTSLRVGHELPDKAARILSEVAMSVSASGSTNAIDYFSNMFGISASSMSIGSGDKNFRLHVADNRPQFQIGDSSGQVMRVGFEEMSADALGVANLDMTTIEGANRALSTLNSAIDKVSAERSRLGAYQNRLESTMLGLRSSFDNLTAAESHVRDTDVAAEMIEFTRNQIVSQTGIAMVAQANLSPASVLDLLK